MSTAIVTPNLTAIASLAQKCDNGNYVAKFGLDLSHPQQIGGVGAWDVTTIVIQSNQIQGATPQNFNGMFRGLNVVYSANAYSVLRITVNETGQDFFLGSPNLEVFQSTEASFPLHVPTQFSLTVRNYYYESGSGANADQANLFLMTEEIEPFFASCVAVLQIPIL